MWVGLCSFFSKAFNFLNFDTIYFSHIEISGGGGFFTRAKIKNLLMEELLYSVVVAIFSRCHFATRLLTREPNKKWDTSNSRLLLTSALFSNEENWPGPGKLIKLAFGLNLAAVIYQNS